MRSNPWPRDAARAESCFYSESETQMVRRLSQTAERKGQRQPSPNQSVIISPNDSPNSKFIFLTKAQPHRSPQSHLPTPPAYASVSIYFHEPPQLVWYPCRLVAYEQIFENSLDLRGNRITTHQNPHTTTRDHNILSNPIHHECLQ